jgi:hypothetical protein
VISTLITLSAFFVAEWQTWFYFLIPTLLIVAVAIGMSRTRWYQQIKLAQKAFREEYPDYVVKLTSHEALT